MNSNCIPSDLLRDYLHGDTSNLDTVEIGNHLRSCDECRHRLEAISEESQLRLSTLLRKEKGLGSIHNYRLLEILGQGGMGTVYRALHMQLNRLVAIKVINADRLESPQAKSRFTKEMQMLAQLEHPQIVRASDAGEHEGKPYFVMEYVHGMDLGQLLQRIGPLPYPEACELIRHAASALQFAHDRKILHRDVKPSNMMLASDGRLKLLDLGLAQIVGSEREGGASDSEFAVGTLAYMAPEVVVRGASASSRSDVYSLGVTLFQLLTGIKPYEHLAAPSPVLDIALIRPDLPPELAMLVHQMIAPIPEDRPATMLLVEQIIAPFASNASLRTLVGEYYRWQSRGSYGGPSHSSYVLPPPVQTRPIENRSTSYSAPEKGRRRVTVAAIASIAGLLLIAALVSVVPSVVPFWNMSGDVRGGEERTTSKIGIDALPEDSEKTPIMEKELDQKEPSDPSRPIEPVSPKLATVNVVPRGDFVSSLLQEGRIHLVKDPEGVRYLLSSGKMQLPPGKFTLQFDSPVAIQENGQSVTLESVSDNHLNLSASLKGPGFQFPTIPNQAGAFASYYGSMWREGWADTNPTRYELSIEVLSQALPSYKPGSWMWMQVSGKNLDDPNGYSETATILIDYETWLRKQKLVVGEGYIEVSGLSFPASWSKGSEAGAGNSFVIPFDGSTDWIETRSELRPPANRISIYDYLTLFFASEDFVAAHSTLRSVRASLAKPWQRNDWLEDINNSTGNVSCYVVSSHPKSTYRKSAFYHVARRDDELYGFVEIYVNLESLKASCLRRGQSQEILPGWTLDKRLTDLRSRMVDSRFVDVAKANVAGAGMAEERVLETKPVKPKEMEGSFLFDHFDLAMLPSSPARVQWSGMITRRGRTELVDIHLQTLESGLIDGVQGTCIECSVISTMEGEEDHREWARIWIDSEQYENAGSFRMLRGWIALDKLENAYVIPIDGDLNSVIADRLKSPESSRFDRFGATDILIMALGAEYTPKTSLGRLRERLTGIFVGLDRKPERHGQVTKIGQVDGYVWQQANNPIATYRFFRSEDVPFGFVSTRLEVLQSVEVRLETLARTTDAALVQSFFGDEATLVKNVERNRSKHDAIQPKNWRYWEWKSTGSTYKAFAEFGGTIKSASNPNEDEYLVIVDSVRRAIRIPVAELSVESRRAIELGRHWASYDRIPNMVLVEDRVRTREVIVRDIKSRFPSSPLQFDSLPESDRSWIMRLRNVKSRSTNITSIKKEWEDFHLYKSD